MCASDSGRGAHSPGALLSELETHVAENLPEGVPDEVVQRLMTLAVRAYFTKRDAGYDFCPLASELSATEIIVSVANLLQTAELGPFDLGMLLERCGD